MYEFKLPDVGEGIHEAEILKWLVKVGERVAQNQPMLEIQTDKAVVEIPSPVAGAITEIRAEVGAITQVGDVLVVIETDNGQTTPAPSLDFASSHNAAGQDGNAAHAAEEKSPGIAGPGKRVLAAPAVRKLALELGIDLSQVSASGPAGRVLPTDVRRFVQQQAEAKPVEVKTEATAQEIQASAPPELSQAPRQSSQEIIEEEPLHGLRRRIAERMEQAWRIPHVTSFEEVEVSSLVALRRHLQPEAERRGVRLTYLPFMIKAAVQVLKEFPYFNASLDMERQKILRRRTYHLGIAMAVPDGLLVPVIHHADQLTLLQLAAELNRLNELAQQRRLSQAELSGSTFTITNFGSFGSYQGTPIINPPEVAILGCGRIEEKPVVVQGQIEARPVLPLALSYDHRLLDGAAAGAFLGRLKMLLSDPNLLFLELV
ncbi:MAG: dihydrolipoyllysine-residue acetyltransferase component of pyruvate dehydrogenase complex [Chloroflexota bacterium]|nr:MAG: dihydrolipoyllysine-residue acetyltransferase component of pyruvate dehydrogenase complex [Chloroflexota bacterium]